MVLTNRESIRDVVLFPLLKPQAGEAGGTGDGSPAMLSPRPPSPGDVDVTQMERDLARVESELRKAATKGKIPVMFSQDKDGSLHVLNM